MAREGQESKDRTGHEKDKEEEDEDEDVEDTWSYAPDTMSADGY